MAKNYNVKCSVTLTKERLRRAKLFGLQSAKKPLISIKNREARINFAKEHFNWTPQHWSKVLWSDKSKFMIFGSDGIRYICRSPGERFNPKYQFLTV